MLASGSPWVSRRLSPEVLEEITRSFFLTLWNTYGFFTLYAGLAGFDPTAPATAAKPTALDRWALAELADTVREVTERLDAYDPAVSGRRLTTFVEDLSNWYVRLSRRRFWRGAGEDSEAAFRTLWTCLRTLALLLAPYTPFVAEELAQGLQAGERVAVEVPGLGSVELGPEEAGVVEEPVTGWRVVREGGASVALDLTVTPELRLEGLARDLVRAVQDLRKDAGLEVSDRIELAVDADGEVAAAVRAHGDYLQAETLAVALYDAPRADGSEASLELDGSPVRLWLRPVDAG